MRSRALVRSASLLSFLKTAFSIKAMAAGPSCSWNKICFQLRTEASPKARSSSGHTSWCLSNFCFSFRSPFQPNSCGSSCGGNPRGEGRPVRCHERWGLSLQLSKYLHPWRLGFVGGRGDLEAVTYWKACKSGNDGSCCKARQYSLQNVSAELRGNISWPVKICFAFLWVVT